ncbi:MAG: hypothetical protein Q7S20_10220 [Gemmatimonadaceae bacterium]|nr:hypothetical protein [Gemmatimonadaceae bacterium]
MRSDSTRVPVGDTALAARSPLNSSASSRTASMMRPSYCSSERNGEEPGSATVVAMMTRRSCGARGAVTRQLRSH